MIARRLVVHGRVHGVGFRAAMVDAAVAYGLSGWVRNRTGGQVEAHVQGASQPIDAIVAWCRRGPPAASVRVVEVAEVPVDAAAGFRILPTA